MLLGGCRWWHSRRICHGLLSAPAVAGTPLQIPFFLPRPLEPVLAPRPLPLPLPSPMEPTAAGAAGHLGPLPPAPHPCSLPLALPVSWGGLPRQSGSFILAPLPPLPLRVVFVIWMRAGAMTGPRALLLGAAPLGGTNLTRVFGRGVHYDAMPGVYSGFTNLIVSVVCSGYHLVRREEKDNLGRWLVWPIFSGPGVWISFSVMDCCPQLWVSPCHDRAIPLVTASSSGYKAGARIHGAP